MQCTKLHISFLSKLYNNYKAELATLRSTVVLLCSFLFITTNVSATNYLVNNKTDLQTRMSNAIPGDTVILANGIYNFGQINFTNNSSVNTSPWIVLMPQTFNGVTFTGNTYLQFAGRRIHITGFRFASGNSGTNDVIQFRSSSSIFAHYCRVSNVTIDNYNSDSTGSVLAQSPNIDNKWVSIYGTNNRLDHCTFINKFNAGATVTVWYNNNNYPQESTPTYHLIDSNYFKGRGYLGENGGETIRLGTSTTSRTNGFNTVAYNLFEDCIQTEPEIISNKSDFNTYCYNTFKNCNGGLTLRHGRYCNVFGNFFIVDNPSRTRSYGVRVIDKGHKIFNNYFEGLRGNNNSLTSLRCPIILYNGAASTNDTTNASLASGYFSADSCLIAFNTIVNCFGGAGVVLGFRDGNNFNFEPLGIRVANNLIQMNSGQALLIQSGNTQLTYTAEGNLFNASNGLGVSNTNGFQSSTLNFGSRTNGLLKAPTLVTDAAINSNFYSSIINSFDALQQTRTPLYDIGCVELNGNNTVVSFPLDSNLVGAGKPNVILSVQLQSFNGTIQINQVHLKWQVEREINFKKYIIEYSSNNQNFIEIGAITASNLNSYSFLWHEKPTKQNFFRLKLVNADGTFKYSNVILLHQSATNKFLVYPNPAKDFLIFENNLSFVNTQIQIVSVDGKLIEKIPYNHSTQKIALDNYVNGTYIVQLLNNNQIIQSQQIIISK